MSNEAENNALVGEEEQRPPVDPHNKLYTVISLLIFAVVYFGGGYIKDNFTMTYAMYADSWSDADKTILLREIGMDKLPEGVEAEYARLHRLNGGDTLYIALSVSAELAESESFPDCIIPYEYGNVIYDERFTVYPSADMTADYVYGDLYVCTDDPAESCLIYDNGDGCTAVFTTDDFDGKVKSTFGKGVKIPVK